MAGARKPKLELYWTVVGCNAINGRRVNWRLVAANGEVLCQCTQGFRDKADAMRNVETVVSTLIGPIFVYACRIVGPGRKPSAA